jgi:hypothetical protein
MFSEPLSRYKFSARLRAIAQDWIKHLWQWLREDVTFHNCYEKEADLIDKVQPFQHSINANPNETADRLWVSTHLDPEVEKLRVST